MKHTAKRLMAFLLCAAVLAGSLILPAAAAAETLTDEDFTKIVTTPGTYGCSSAQGMAVGDKYLYASMVGGSNVVATIWRIDKESGAIRGMKNGDTDENTFSNLGHVNDMDWALIGDKEYLYVLASGNDIETGNIIVFEIDGRTLYQKAQYTLHYNGGNFNPNGMAVYKVDGEEITFAFKWSHKTISTGSIELDATEGRIPVSILCYLDSGRVEVNGKKRNFTGFANQGIFIKDDILFANYAGCYDIETVYQSLILGFDLSQAGDGYAPTLQPEEDLIFYLESEEYPRCFEIEDCGISSDGKLYFSANCWKSTSDTGHDGVFVLNDFVYQAKEKPWENPFTDVKEEDWFYNDVAFVNTKGLLIGITLSEYWPQANLERGQMTTVLWRLAGKPAPKNAASFTDVKKDWYYTDAIAWAAENKIVEGHGVGTFTPDAPLTREEAMAILYRYAELGGLAKASTADAGKYTCSDWAKAYVSWAVECGLLDIGTDVSDLTKPANRAEIAAYLTRLYKNVIEK